MSRDVTTYVMPCATAAESQALRRRAAAAAARYAAPVPPRGGSVTTMADGARLRPVAKVAPGVRVGQNRARQQWALAHADMDATARRWQAVQERAAGIASALRLMGHR